MKLTLTRTFLGSNFTLGSLYLEYKWICYTLEDQVREVEGQPVSQWKVKGETAIPLGTYPVTITYSNRFLRNLPLISNVEGFEGIRIHSGNSDKDTEGCILVGMTWDGKDDWIGGSVIAFNKLYPLLEQTTDPIFIEINNDHGAGIS
jgi:hypothetical protein